MAARGVPGEQFSFSLAVDALDMIADGSANPIGAGLATVSAFDVAAGLLPVALCATTRQRILCAASPAPSV